MEIFKGITIIGLGPGNIDLITKQTWEWINQLDVIYLRTAQHPAVAGFPKRIKIISFDEYYQQFTEFEKVYEKIVNSIIELASAGTPVTYAVPGHPFVAEMTSPLMLKKAKERNIPVRVFEAVSFLEPTFTALAVDPFSSITLMDAFDVADANFPQFPPSRPVLISQIYSRMIAAEVKLTLLEVYHDEHPVKLIHAAGTKQQLIESIPLYEIDRSKNIGILTSLYVEPIEKGTSFEEFQEIIAHLRAPDGCPWDREQDHKSLRPHLLSETYELLSALDDENPGHLKEELGDLLLQIVLHAQIAAEEGDFIMADVIKGISDKLIRRHPHVFAQLQVDGVENVLTNWEKIKETERSENGKKDNNGVLSGVPNEYPALAQSQEIQNRAARVGFDWDQVEPVIQKIHEEINEIADSTDREDQLKELGDLLFAIVNLIRWYDGDAESILRETNLKFRRRFNFIEQEVKKLNKSMKDFSLAELDDFWDQVKGLGL
ncbi:MAG: nucleoside triphosphate pyrophosphohydrolase [Anaerolineaceae bacterium]|nr:nucleoside triphosphate pyrophosphohydrolase [Anaerolineaceae bacterium]